MEIELGKKQFALLLLVYSNKSATVSQVQEQLQEGVYKTLQAHLNKLVAKKILKTIKKSGILHYLLDDAGTVIAQRFTDTLCDKCLNLTMIRALFH